MLRPQLPKQTPFLAEYLRNISRLHKPKTAELYECAAKQVERFGDVELSNITTFWLEQFKQHLLKSVSSNSAASYFIKIKAALNRAELDGIISSNPSKRVKNISAKARLRETLSEEDLKKLCEVPKWTNESPFMRCAFVFQYCTGLRFSDMRALKKSMIDGSTIKFIAQKTGKPKRLPLSEGAKQCIEIALQLQKQMSFESEYVFLVSEDVGVYNRSLQTWARKAGIQKKITSHVGRHSFATNLILRNVPLSVVQHLLDHAKPETTAIYTHITEAIKASSVNVLPVPPLKMPLQMPPKTP